MSEETESVNTQTTQVRSVAVLGLGTMGAAMADRIIDAGPEVTVWNRSAGRCEPFAGRARVASSPAEAVTGADAVLTMLFDAGAVRAVMSEVLPAMTPGAVWMQSSTVGTLASSEFAAAAADAGVRFVDAPMLGTKQPALDGALTAVTAGDDSAVDELATVLQAVASRTLRAGDAAPAASALKLAVNTWIATLTAGIGQSLTIAERLGVDPGLVLTALDGTASDSPYAHTKGGEVLKGSFDPQFAVSGLLKDVRLAREETPRISHAMLNALDELYTDTVDAGSGGEDIAAVWRAFQR